MSRTLINTAMMIGILLSANQLTASESRVGIVDIYELEDVISQLVALNPVHARIRQTLEQQRSEMSRLQTEISNSKDDSSTPANLEEQMNALRLTLRHLEMQLYALTEETSLRLLEEVAAGRYAIILSTDGRSEVALFRRPNVDLIDLTPDLKALAIKQFIAAGGSVDDVSEED